MTTKHSTPSATPDHHRDFTLSNQISDEVDQKAKQLAIDAHLGRIPEDEARRQIVWAIESTGIVWSLVVEPRHLDERLRLDLSAEISDYLFLKAMGDGTPMSLDLGRIRAGENGVMGWARQLLRGVAASKLRDLRYRDSRHIPTDPTPAERYSRVTAADFQYHHALAPSIEGAQDAAVFSSTLESYERIKGLRKIGQTRQDAHHLRQAYGITAKIDVPRGYRDRVWVQMQLENDEMLAYQSLTQWLAIVTSRPHRGEMLDDRILGIWDEFTVDEAEDLHEFRPGFAHTIALAALYKAPKPSRTTIRSVVQTLTMAAAGSAWEKHARALVNSWVARECNPVSEFATKTSKDSGDAGAAVKDLVEADRAAAAWPHLVAETVAWHRQPLGGSANDVSRFIARAFHAVDPNNFTPAGEF